MVFHCAGQFMGHSGSSSPSHQTMLGSCIWSSLFLVPASDDATPVSTSFSLLEVIVAVSLATGAVDRCLRRRRGYVSQGGETGGHEHAIDTKKKKKLMQGYISKLHSALQGGLPWVLNGTKEQGLISTRRSIRVANRARINIRLHSANTRKSSCFCCNWLHLTPVPRTLHYFRIRVSASRELGAEGCTIVHNSCINTRQAEALG